MLTGKGSGKNISGFLPTDPELLRKAKERSSLKREIKKINIYEYIEEIYDYAKNIGSKFTTIELALISYSGIVVEKLKQQKASNI